MADEEGEGTLSQVAVPLLELVRRPALEQGVEAVVVLPVRGGSLTHTHHRLPPRPTLLTAFIPSLLHESLNESTKKVERCVRKIKIKIEIHKIKIVQRLFTS